MPTQLTNDVAHKLGWFLERVLHRRRRRMARRRLAQRRVRSVLFLCHGNLYRSPYAAAAFRRAFTAINPSMSTTVASAGFIAAGRRVPDAALDVARDRGIELASHRSAVVTRQALNAADLVAVMSADQARAIRSRYGNRARVLVLGDLDPSPIQTRTIADPLGCDAEIVAQVYSRIDRCVAQLAAVIAKARRS